MNRHFALAALVFMSLLVRVEAQPHSAPGPASLLHVRFTGPQGMYVSVYQGQAAPRELPAPAAIGLRPGYIYRVRLHDMAEFPGVSLYPSLEVRGSLELPPGMSAANYPAPIHFSDEDIRRALSGVLVTKVIYLEHPERANPTAAQPGQALEADSPPQRDIVE